MQWVLEPDSATLPIGKNCKIYVLNQVDDTVWLKTKVYNKCSPQGIEQRYWFICSFYGIGEDGPSTNSGTFEVIPNPNNGQMTLSIERMTGRLELSVYDMLGTLIDRMPIENVSESLSIPYHLSAKASGIYCFVLTGKEGIITKKVILTP